MIDKKQNQIFEDFKLRKISSIKPLLELEKENLYNYIFRMTGQVDKTIDGIYETFSIFEKNKSQHEDIKNLLVEVYSEARKIMLNTWNEDTSNLKNIHIEKKIAEKNVNPDDMKRIKEFSKIDHIVASLELKQREIAILYIIRGFSIEDTAKIMDENVPVIVIEHSSLLRELNLKIKAKEDVQKILKKLPKHPIPHNESLQITDLQELMVGIKKKAPSSLKKILILITIIAVIFIAYFYFVDQGKSIMHVVKSLKLKK